MITLIKASLGLFLFVIGTNSENTVFTDATFPYRVVCNSEWVQQDKSDTMLLLKNATPGKKTRLQLVKYEVDSGYDSINKDWSRLRYSINLKLITQFGRIGFFDTTQNKKLGGLRAFEIYALYWEKTGDQTLWWAEYTRWTDSNGVGYMASIIGDTLDMRENVKNKSYVNLLDSIHFFNLQTTTIPDINLKNILVKQNTIEQPDWYNILGRNLQTFYGKRPGTIIVKKNIKQCIFR